MSSDCGAVPAKSVTLLQIRSTSVSVAAGAVRANLSDQPLDAVGFIGRVEGFGHPIGVQHQPIIRPQLDRVIRVTHAGHDSKHESALPIEGLDRAVGTRALAAGCGHRSHSAARR